jgi:hypothetical protein
MEQTQEIVAYHSTESTIHVVLALTHGELYPTCNDKMESLNQ